MKKASYKVSLTPVAQRQLKKLTKPTQNMVIGCIELLKNTPRPRGVKKLTGIDSIYRVKVKDYRILYTINDKQLLILVIKIGNRKEIYRD